MTRRQPIRWPAVVMLAAMSLPAACQSPSEAVPSTLQPSTEDPATTVPLDGDLAVVRDMAFAYWEAFNEYDPERVLSMLEDGYGAEREDTIRREIGQIRTFGVTLRVTESSPPVMLGSDTAEMFLDMKEPLGTRHIRMGFRLVDGEWLIDFAQETD
jgi:hypothetical protein